MTGHIVLLIIGNICCASAVIMIRLSGEHPMLLAAYRQLLAALMLTPLFLRDLRRNKISARYCFRVARWPGLALGLHFITWITAARMTPAVNASLIVNLVPVVMPLLLFFMVGERLHRAEFFATLLALAGLLILTVDGFRVNPEYFLGDMLCLLAMLLLAFYLVLARVNRGMPTIWLYVVPVYFTGGVISFLAALPVVNPLKPYTTPDILLIIGLAVIPTIIGHSILNRSMKYLRGQVVSLFNMSQFVFAGVMAYFILEETPTTYFYPASALLVAAVLIVSLRRKGTAGYLPPITKTLPGQ